jgi:hypothetical protein
MRTKVKVALPELVLTRILDALGQELIDASDDEIMEAAKELGMDPHMKGSAAFLGLTFPTRVNISDVFDLEAIKDLIAHKTRERISNSTSRDPESKAVKLKLSESLTDRKNSDER